MPKPSIPLGALMGLMGFACFAAYDMSIKFLGAGYHPFQIMAAAGVMSLPLLALYVVFDPEKGPLLPRRPGWMAVRAVTLTLNGMLGTYAFSTLPLAQCYVIFFTMPLFIAALSPVLLKERIDPIRMMAVLIGLVGVVIALEPGKSALAWGHAAALAGSAVGAVQYMIIRKVGAEERTATILIWPLVAQFLAAALLLPLVWQPMPMGDLLVSAWMAVAVVVGMLFIIAAYRMAPALVVAPMQYSQILWAAIFGALLFDETMERSVIPGAALIIIAGLIVVARQDRAPQPPPDAQPPMMPPPVAPA